MLLYETRFCPLLMEITEHSKVSEAESFDECDLLYGDPVVERLPYRVYEDGVLVSVFPWSLPPRGELSPEDEFDLLFG